MTLVFCIDKFGGLLFNHRRPARDAKQIENLLKIRGNRRIVAEPYSEDLLGDAENVIYTDDVFGVLEKDDIFFSESPKINEYFNLFDEIIVYRWNFPYPFDVTFDVDLPESGYRRFSSVRFKGDFHPKITRDIFRKHEETKDGCQL